MNKKEEYQYSVGVIVGFLETQLPLMKQQVEMQPFFLRDQVKEGVDKLEDAVNFIKGVHEGNLFSNPGSEGESEGIPLIDVVPVSGKGVVEIMEDAIDGFLKGEVPLGEFYDAEFRYKQKMGIIMEKMGKVQNETRKFFKDGGR